MRRGRAAVEIRTPAFEATFTLGEVALIPPDLEVDVKGYGGRGHGGDVDVKIARNRRRGREQAFPVEDLARKGGGTLLGRALASRSEIVEDPMWLEGDGLVSSFRVHRRGRVSMAKIENREGRRRHG